MAGEKLMKTTEESLAPSHRLEGKVAVITGGNSGIGLATAERFVAEGAFVFITGRRQTALDAAVERIGRNVTAVRGDVTNLADLDRLHDVVMAEKGRVDILFANAGEGELVPLGQITEAHYHKMMDLNVKGVLFSVQKLLPLMPEGASIILNASAATIKGIPASSVYSAAKAAVRSFARTWTVDLKDRKIRVNTISPGPIETPATDKLGGGGESTKKLKANLAAMVPMGRIGQPDEFAKAVVFLASEDSSFVTGIELFVDGGLTQC
jgi:NAD(P)-dependent dehydrogenase (short-subunit alcohol dehydrogenase family)